MIENVLRTHKKEPFGDRLWFVPVVINIKHEVKLIIQKENFYYLDEVDTLDDVDTDDDVDTELDVDTLKFKNTILFSLC